MNLFKKWKDENPSLKSEYDYLIEYAYSKSYKSINGEEEITFTKDSNCIEIYHDFGRKRVIIEIIVSYGEGRMNLSEMVYGLKKPFNSIDETKVQIGSFLRRYTNTDIYDTIPSI